MPLLQGGYLDDPGRGNSILDVAQRPKVTPNYEDLAPLRAYLLQQPVGVTAVTLELREGGVLRATRTVNPSGDAISFDQFVLTAAEVSSIVNPGNLEIWVTADGAEGLRGVVTEISLTVPPSAPGQPIIIGQAVDRAALI